MKSVQGGPEPSSCHSITWAMSGRLRKGKQFVLNSCEHLIIEARTTPVPFFIPQTLPSSLNTMNSVISLFSVLFVCITLKHLEVLILMDKNVSFMGFNQSSV